MSPFNELVAELKTLDNIRQFHGNLSRWRENLQTLADAKAQALRMGKSLKVRFDRPAFRSAAAGSRIEPVEALLRDYGKARATAENVGTFINSTHRQVVAKALKAVDRVGVSSTPAKKKPTRKTSMKTAPKSPSIAGSYAAAPYKKPKRAATAADVIARATKARAELVAQITLGKMTAAEINARDLKLRNIIARANKAQTASA